MNCAENLYPFRMSSSDEMNGTGTSSMSNRCFDNSHSINNTPSQSQKQLNTSGKRVTPSTASSKGPSMLTLPRHADRPVLEINCDLANDPPTHPQSQPQGGERDADSRTRNNSGLSDTGSTAPLQLSLPVPSYKIPALPLHAYSSSSSSGSNCIGMGSSPEDNLDPEAQQSGFERTSLCCEFDDHFKEMQIKREECDKRNEHIFVSEANTAVVKKILIVDDSVLCRKIIIKVLDGANYSFETAGNGRDACEKLCK